MFDNIGEKIKTLAKITCWMGIICSVIFGGTVMADGSDLLGLIIMAIGSLISWVSSFALYGFGQLIENSDQLVLYAETNASETGNGKTKRGKRFVKENMDTEKDVPETVSKPKTKKPKDFSTEIKETKTDDLELILKDQRDLYSEEEIKIIEKELLKRKSSK